MNIFGLKPYGANDWLDFEKRFFGFPQTMSVSSFKTDIVDNGDSYALSAELPGFKKEDIDIRLEGDYLVIEAKHEENREEKNDNYVRRERSYGSFSRSFDITGVDVSGIGAKYENGVLELKLPKQAEVPAQQKRINID